MPSVASTNRGWGRLRCVESQDFCDTCNKPHTTAEQHYKTTGCKGSFTGCGWEGPSQWVRTFGMTVWLIEECPDCQGKVECEE